MAATAETGGLMTEFGQLRVDGAQRTDTFGRDKYTMAAEFGTHITHINEGLARST